jgi:hypothetical protein
MFMRNLGAPIVFTPLLLYSSTPSVLDYTSNNIPQCMYIPVCMHISTIPSFARDVPKEYVLYIHTQAPLVVTMELASIATKAFQWLARAPAAAPTYTLNKTTATTLRSILVSDFLQLHCPFCQSLFYSHSLSLPLSLLCDLPDTAICVPSPMPG